ncbi:response regulator [Plastoroseomonas arctica]|uniref:Response regulator transcription factor n=1 Tax=Plastoroseomonas arctica TaxID=1509237 RepID=A0AAF1JYV3_9PROT|nr:response regulator transcription factor [Plastoroseomonas arctica]MBR0657022.1 response regulator transcription factor [Plastoroseomonas arctica]
MSASRRVALVEDDPVQRHIVAEYLAQHGLRPAPFGNARDFRREYAQELPDLALIDVHLNDAEDGFALARWARARSARMGIIMLTAAGDVIDRVAGLESGADDYVTKPFEPRELLARVRALLRRAADAPAPPALQVEHRVGTARLDLERHVLTLADGSEDTLTASEFDLLALLVRHPNRPLTREWLLEQAAHREAEAFDRAIDNRIMRLRKKVEADPAKPQALKSVRGVGYMFVPPSD